MFLPKKNRRVLRKRRLGVPSAPQKLLRPFILSCDKRLPSLKVFIDSFLRVKDSLKQPIIFAGYSSKNEGYTSLLKQLDPVEIIPQPPNRSPSLNEHIRECMVKEFPRIIASKYPNEDILFLEDDALLSSCFSEAVSNIQLLLASRKMHLLTLYAQGSGYNLDSRAFVIPFNGNSFHGNVGLVFSHRLMQWWVGNVDKIDDKSWRGCWDWCIGRGFENNSPFTWFTTSKSYVQHQVGYSVIDSKVKMEQSDSFIE